MSKTQKNARREAAEKRQARYDAMTTEQKLAMLDTRPGNSARERARLQ